MNLPRGYAILYREGETNHCPGCGHTHWHIGRGTAECAFCTTALPYEGASSGAQKQTAQWMHKGQPVRRMLPRTQVQA